ncbi:GIY-YIG nuclease family protein [Patescibacteria group bacterium]|nr:GIY-YIG nuclease family protein [Patescibacteria group bacterium]
MELAVNQLASCLRGPDFTEIFFENFLKNRGSSENLKILFHKIFDFSGVRILTIMKYYLYLLESQIDKSYYLGVTNNIKRRLKEHNSGHSKYTKSKRPWKLIDFIEYDSISEAYKNERMLKQKKKRELVRSFFK